ncbi:MAG: hypothetical protein ABI836_02030, partial [Gemmatimonadota bacterium]
GRWLTAHTTHFRIHYRPGADSLAMLAAREGERAYAALARELVPPRQSIDLVLSDAADFSNGSAQVSPSNRIVLLVTPPLDVPELQNYDDWLRLLISHELTHIFHLDRVKGPWGVVQAVLGRLPGTFPNNYQPAWVAEGLATYYESRLTGRGRVWGSFHTQLLAAAALGDRWLSAGEATYISPRWPDGIAAYAYGSRFFARLAEAGGDSAVPRFIEKTSGQLVPFRTGHPIGAVSGIRRDSLWSSMKREYEQRAAHPESAAEVVASKLRAPPAAAASHGDLAWFESRGDEPAAIVVKRANGQVSRYRTTSGVDLAWAGDTLYATWLELADPFTYRSDLHRLVGDQWQQMTHGARLTDLAAGAAGVVAVQVTGTGNRLGILTDDSVIALTQDPPGTTWASPAMHPSGAILAVQHDRFGYHVVSISPGSTREAELVGATGNQVLTDPVWSPDGSLLFYASDESGLPQVHVMHPDGGVLTLTTEPAGATQPMPASDGWLYFTALEADGYAVKRIRWDPDALADRLSDASGITVSGPEKLVDATDSLASAVAIRTGGYAPWAALRPHYFVPLIIKKGSAGTFIGLLTSGSDPVGRVAYGIQLGVGTEGARLDGVLSVIYQRWAHRAVDLYLSQDWGDAGRITSPISADVRSRERDAELGVSNLWAGWYRSLALRVAGHYEEDHFESSPELAFINPAFAGVSVTLGTGTLERPPLAISNEDGITLSARYRHRWRLDTEGWSEDWRGRIAVYEAIKGIGLFAHPVLAGKVSMATSSGP